MSRVLMLDLMLKHLKNKHVMAAEIVVSVNKELERLASPDVQQSIQSYLIANNGIKMQGTEHIWKYRLNRGCCDEDVCRNYRL